MAGSTNGKKMDGFHTDDDGFRNNDYGVVLSASNAQSQEKI